MTISVEFKPWGLSVRKHFEETTTPDSVNRTYKRANDDLILVLSGEIVDGLIDEYRDSVRQFTDLIHSGQRVRLSIEAIDPDDPSG